MLFEN